MKSFDRNDPELWEYIPKQFGFIAYNSYRYGGIGYKMFFTGEKPQARGLRFFQHAPLHKVKLSNGLALAKILPPAISVNPVENWQDSLTERPR